MVVATLRATSTQEAYVPLGTHLVGSVPLAGAEDVFRTAGAALRDRCGASRTARRGRARTGSRLLHEALDTIFGGRPTFRCCWTYVTATRGGSE